MKIDAGRSKMMVLNGEEGLECEIQVFGMCLDEAGTSGAECSRNV